MPALLKKQSAAKPPETVFFVDRSLGIEPLRSTLIRAGVRVEIHDDHFKRDEEDQVWLVEVSKRSWIVLTKDQRLRYRPLEISALRDSGARVFVLIAGNLRGSEIADIFEAALPRIQRILATRVGPFLARISKNALVTVSE
jgi:predicted nuclease of predicted toxin-antitoxin system